MFTIKRRIFLLILPLAVLAAALPAQEQGAEVDFHGFPWGASMETVIAKMGQPVSRESINGLQSLVWENIIIGDYTAYMLAYFSRAGLQGGTYYFITYDWEHLMQCYKDMQADMRDKFGPTPLLEGIIRELRPFESAWNLPGGYVYLKVNARQGEPVALWFSSPELSKQLFGSAN